MNLQDFQRFTVNNLRWLQGVCPEELEDLLTYEQKLGFPLPPSLKWLLSEYGYSMACGVENLEESVELTLDCRRKISLPKDILLINDWNDGGLVFMIANQSPYQEYPIIWSDTGDIYTLIEGKPLPSDVSKYENFPLWVADRVLVEEEESNYDKQT